MAMRTKNSGFSPWLPNIPLLTGGIMLCFFVSGCSASPVSKNPTLSSTEQNIRKKAAEDLDDLKKFAAPQRTKTRSRLGLPLADFTKANFIGSGRCALCHAKLLDSTGNDMSITNHWRSTMMANAAKDPFWQAKVQSETTRNPALKKVIEKKCVTCHMPMAWTQKMAQKETYKTDEEADAFDAFLKRSSDLHQAAMDGVSCSLCHQIQDSGLGSSKSFSGKFVIDTRQKAPDRPIFGPYRDPQQNEMRTSVGFTPVYGPQTNDSALCATCHTLYTPYVDAEGNIAGEFPEQTVYLEWLHSDYGEPVGRRHDIGDVKGEVRICQECHMPHSEAGGVIIAKPAPPEAKAKDHFSQHHFVGGNAFMLNILQDNIVPLGITASTAKLEATKTRTVKQLQSNSARLSFLKTKLRDNQLTAEIQVKNNVGHKFPTGFPSRRAWIHLSVRDNNGSMVFESGKPLDNGGITGDNSDDHAGFEPHYDLITAPDQVQIYESVMGNTDAEVTFTLLRGAGYLKDNRLLPRGFVQKTASPDIAVYGNARKDKNFIGGTDQITYKINTAEHPAPFTVKAELFYTPVSFAFMEDLRRDDTFPLVGRFMRYFDKADKMPVTIAVIRKSID